MADEQESPGTPLTPELRAKLAEEWKRKIVVALDETGYLRGGWGYPQSTPNIIAFNERLRTNPDPLSALHELLEEDQTPPKP